LKALGEGLGKPIDLEVSFHTKVNKEDSKNIVGIGYSRRFSIGNVHHKGYMVFYSTFRLYKNVIEMFKMTCYKTYMERMP